MLTKKDLAAVRGQSSTIAKHFNPGSRLTVRKSLLAFVFGLILAIVSGSFAVPLSYLLSVAVAFVLGLLVFAFINFQVLQRHNNSELGAQLLDFDDSGIVFHCDGGFHSFEWTGVSLVLETKDHFIVVKSLVLIFIIPKRDLSDRQCQYLRKKFQEHGFLED